MPHNGDDGGQQDPGRIRGTFHFARVRVRLNPFYVLRFELNFFLFVFISFDS